MKNIIIGLLIIICLLFVYLHFKPEQKTAPINKVEQSISTEVNTGESQEKPEQNTPWSNLKTSTMEGSGGKTITVSHSSTLTAIPRGSEFNPELLVLIDSKAQLAVFGIDEILPSEIIEARKQSNSLEGLIDEQKFAKYSVKQFQGTDIKNSKTWFIDFGNYGLQVFDYSEGKYMIDWSSFRIK